MTVELSLVGDDVEHDVLLGVAVASVLLATLTVGLVLYTTVPGEAVELFPTGIPVLTAATTVGWLLYYRRQH